MAINIKGAFALTHHACAHWRAVAERGERPGGRIINTASGIGLYGFPRGGLYGASKGAIVSLTMVTAMEMRPPRRHGERDLARGADADGQGDLPRGARGPGGVRPVRPGEHLAAGVYLSSDAAAWLTGQVLYVQGDRIRRMADLAVAGEYHSADGRSLLGRAIGDALPLLYGTLPAIQPETRLIDAIEGIDPEREATAEASAG